MQSSELFCGASHWWFFFPFCLRCSMCRELCERDGINYINREDDSGDLGLRTSKTQYQPIKLINKNFVEVEKPMQIKTRPVLRGEKVILSKITEEDKENYYKLYTNKSLNKYWGYDYTKDIKTPSLDAFFNLQKNDFKIKDNMCLAVRKKGSGEFVGEVVLHNFTYDKKVEVGVRILKKYQNQKFGSDAVKTLCKYVVEKLKLQPVAKCYLQNASSLKSLQNSGFIVKNADKKFYYLNFLT